MGASSDDPSEELDEALWEAATPVEISGFIAAGRTVLWKEINAYWKTDDEKRFTNQMRRTGQWTVKKGHSAFMEGTNVREKK